MLTHYYISTSWAQYPWERTWRAINVQMYVNLSFIAKLQLDECMTFWGEPERVYVQNVEQLHRSSACN